MRLKCQDCGNDQEFISERYYLHWVDIDNEGNVTAVEGAFQGENTDGLMPRDPVFIECANCNSQVDVEDEG